MNVLRWGWLVLLGAVSLPLAAATADHVAVHVTSGTSLRTWHGQAEVHAVRIEAGRSISEATELALVVAPLAITQPRSWFGDEFGDGDERVLAGSVSLLVRRRFRTQSSTLQWYAEASTGPMYARKAVPASTSRFNFISEAGGGAILRPSAAFPIYAGWRFSHISNGGYSPRNPGLNVWSLTLGTRFRLRR